MDCPQPFETATFYQALLGGFISPEDQSADWINLFEPSGRQILSFQRAENYVASTWPDNTVPDQVHIDILVDSHDEAEPAVFAAGGRLIDGSDDHPSFRGYADHIGRPFCLVVERGRAGMRPSCNGAEARRKRHPLPPTAVWH
ncbi:VOC family protein [Brevibacterium sandarakinum]|uniref:VOC family protein n=1 Tax=Brevibacterium sandarakinum TaxID=629680 RepID=UPI00264ABB0E|nr:VOC family protein [Brevibacterium sandarakinum]MDN5657354.1 VOC family protein [Brevibacterium sandarakinum]